MLASPRLVASEADEAPAFSRIPDKRSERSSAFEVEARVVVVRGGGRHASTSNLTTMVRPSNPCVRPGIRDATLYVTTQGAHIFHNSVVAGAAFAARRGNRAFTLEIEAVSHIGVLPGELLPTIEQDRVPRQLSVDPEILEHPIAIVIDPPQQLAQVVAIGHDIYSTPGDGVAVIFGDLVDRSKQREESRGRHPVPVLVHVLDPGIERNRKGSGFVFPLPGRS